MVQPADVLAKSSIEGKLDWEKWLGPRRRGRLDAIRFHNWYYFWDYSGGLMVGQAAHIIDAINMIMGSTFPAAVTAAATRTHLEGAEVPETTNMAIEYGDEFLAVFTLGYAAMQYLPPHDLHKHFHGLDARFDIGRESFALYPAQLERELAGSETRDVRTFPGRPWSTSRTSSTAFGPEGPQCDGGDGNHTSGPAAAMEPIRPPASEVRPRDAQDGNLGQRRRRRYLSLLGPVTSPGPALRGGPPKRDGGGMLVRGNGSGYVYGQKCWDRRRTS